MFNFLIFNYWIKKTLNIFLDKKCLYVFFSSGCDSRSLVEFLYFLKNSKIKIFFVFINYNILKESLWWQQHVVTICCLFKVPLLIVQVTYLNNVVKSENLYREIRYHITRLLVSKSFVFTSHTIDDNVETMFFNYFRCSFFKALFIIINTISFKIVFLRPFLYFSSFSILNLSKFFKIYWLEDKSNHSIFYTRNFFRLKVMYFLFKNTRFSFLNCLKFFRYFFLNLFIFFLLSFSKILFFKRKLITHQFNIFFQLTKHLFFNNLYLFTHFKPFFFNWSLNFFLKIKYIKFCCSFNIYNHLLLDAIFFIGCVSFDLVALEIFEYYKISSNDRFFYPLIYFQKNLIGICGLWYSRQYFFFHIFPILLFCFF